MCVGLSAELVVLLTGVRAYRTLAHESIPLHPLTPLGQRCCRGEVVQKDLFSRVDVASRGIGDQKRVCIEIEHGICSATNIGSATSSLPSCEIT